MKKLLLSAFAWITATVGVFGLAACNTGKAVALGDAAEATRLTYKERQEANLDQISAGAEQFASNFSAMAYAQYGDGSNFAVSPISVYMALSVAAECAEGETRSQILSALNVSYDVLKSDFGNLYRSLIAEYKTNAGSISGRLNLTNSIWLNSGMGDLNVNDECIKSLSDNFYCYSRSADFTNDNFNANLAVNNFIKDKTFKLIDRDYIFDEETTFVLVNTLYLKDLWNSDGANLPFTDRQYDFTDSNGNVKSVKLLSGHYAVGRVHEEEQFTHFFATTLHGFKIKFILPKADYSVDEVFTPENVAKVNAVSDYNSLDTENLIRYNTRCLFPEFNATFDKDVAPLLQENFGIRDMFSGRDGDFTALANLKPHFCTAVYHTANLTVDKKGIEGAAVTVIPGAGAPGPGEYTDVYNDFVLDRPFGFIITDEYNVTLFSGVVNVV